jgi:hypothetical protein
MEPTVFYYRVCVNGESVTIAGWDKAMAEARRVVALGRGWRVRILDMQAGEYCWDSAQISAQERCEMKGA